MPLASGIKVEVEFVAGTWTDVTTDVDWHTGWTIRIGRPDTHSAPQVGTASFTLRNSTGKYTPGVQILSDGTTAPYYPNVSRRKRVRISNSAGVRFLGYVKAWNPNLQNGVTGMCAVQATDRLDQLARVTLQSGIQGEILNDTPLAYWPLTDPVGSTQAADSSGVNQNPMLIGGAGAAPVFGGDGPGVEQGTAVSFTGGQVLFAGIGRSFTAFSLVAWVKFSTITGTLEAIVTMRDSNGATRTLVTGSAGPANGVQWVEAAAPSSVGLVTSPGALNDGNWHLIIITQASIGSNVILYVDGVQTVGAPSFLTTTFAQLNEVLIGGGAWPAFTGSVGHVAIYGTVLTPAQVTSMYQVAQQSGELVSDKVKRFLGYAGLTSSDWNVDTSTVRTGTYAQDNADVFTACNDMAVTEGGGSVFYVLQGIVQFRNRAARKPTTPTLTLDAAADLDNGTYQPGLDDQNLVNRVIVSRSTASGQASTQTASSVAGIAAEGLSSASVTTYAAADSDALGLAQSIVASGSTPAYRLPQVGVNLTTAKNNLYASVQATVIGSRIRCTSIPKGQAPATQLDVIVEGWTETANINGYQVVYDTSPADVPARGVYNDATYASYQAQADCALNASITNNATTVVIKSPTSPTFTTAAGAYPLKITVGAERIQLNSAPGGSTSPQTFTNVTRNVDGTTAAAQASGAQVRVCPAVTFTL